MTLATTRAHQWTVDGVGDLGEMRERCKLCAMLRHWAGAHDECPLVRLIGHGMTHEVATARARVQSGQLSRDAKWTGPYRDEPARVCRRCAQVFQRPARMKRVDYCGPVCSAEEKLALARQRMKATRARKKLERTDAR